MIIKFTFYRILILNQVKKKRSQKLNLISIQD